MVTMRKNNQPPSGLISQGAIFMPVLSCPQGCAGYVVVSRSPGRALKFRSNGVVFGHSVTKSPLFMQSNRALSEAPRAGRPGPETRSSAVRSLQSAHPLESNLNRLPGQIHLQGPEDLVFRSSVCSLWADLPAVREGSYLGQIAQRRPTYDRTKGSPGALAFGRPPAACRRSGTQCEPSPRLKPFQGPASAKSQSPQQDPGRLGRPAPTDPAAAL
jgi:hypothetical protein